MVVWIFFPQVKDNAQKIKRAPDNDHGHYRGWNGIEESTPAYDHNASHGDVNKGWDKLPFAREKNLKNNSQCGQAPQNRQQCNAKSIVHVNQQKGGVGASYQEINTDVVKNFKYALCFGVLKAMVKRGKSKKLQKTKSIYRRTNNPWCIITFYGKGY